MQLLVGLFLSILLTTGSSRECADCTAINAPCSGPKKECPYQDDVCMRLNLTVLDKFWVNMARCAPKSDCERYERLIGKPFSGDVINVPLDSIIKGVECSRAPPAFASFFPAFLGLLLMKLLC